MIKTRSKEKILAPLMFFFLKDRKQVEPQVDYIITIFN